MNYNKVVNIVIALLIIINGILFYLNYIDMDRYTLKTADKDALAQMLLRHDVTLSCELPMNYKPQRALELSAGSFEVGVPVPSIFDESRSETIFRSLKFDETIFTQDNKTVTFSSNRMVYEVLREHSANISDTAAIVNKCNAFIKPLELDFNALKLDHIYAEDSYFKVIFIDVFKKMPLFHNSVILYTDDEGVFYADITKYNVISYTGTVRDIYSADEALLALLPLLLDMYPEEKIEITDIKLGYLIDLGGGTSLKAIPFYRIYINGRLEPYFVNAYTNTVNK